MKPRRENGAALVNPTTSAVSIGSALMLGFPWLLLGFVFSRRLGREATHQPASIPAKI
jgi:hypothetical protein